MCFCLLFLFWALALVLCGVLDILLPTFSIFCDLIGVVVVRASSAMFHVLYNVSRKRFLTVSLCFLLRHSVRRRWRSCNMFIGGESTHSIASGSEFPFLLELVLAVAVLRRLVFDPKII